MRTTLTIDDDLAARLERMRRQGRGSLKQLVNRFLRAGMDQLDASEAREARAPYRVQPHDAGRARVSDVDNVADLLATVEGEAFR